MNKAKRISKKTLRPGVVLPLAVTLVVLLFVIGLALLRLGLNARLQAVKTSAQISARAGADAGLTRAFFDMVKKLAVKPWDNAALPSATSVQLPDCYSKYDFQVTGDPAKGFLIESIGTTGLAVRKVYGKLEAKSSLFGIGVKEAIDVKVGATFYTIPADSEFMIRTNSVIPPPAGGVGINAGVEVPGDVVIGPGGDVDVVIDTKHGTVIGNAYAAENEAVFNAKGLPEGLVDGPAIIFDANGEYRITDSGGGLYRYESLTIPAGNTVIIDGEVSIYVEKNTIIGNSGELVISNSSSLDLYLGDDSLEAKQGSVIINENATSGSTDEQKAYAATRFNLYGTDNCTSIILKNAGDLYGAIHAPEADIIIMNSGDLYGALVANSLELKNSGNFYYVSELAAVNINSELTFFEISRWWEE